MMANLDLITVARNFREALWASQDAPAVEDIIAKDCSLHGRAPFFTGFVSGPMAIRHLVDFYKLTFSDIKVTVSHTVCQDNLVTVHWRARAKHTGDLLGVAPTGREVETSGMDLVRIQDGRIAEAWIYWDENGLLSQLLDATSPEGGEPDLLQLVEWLLASKGQ